MIFKLRHFHAALVALLFFVIVQPTLADTASRIELKDGKVYENVTFDVDSRFKVIVIYVGDWTRNVSFPEVALILDEGGNDVTSTYIGEFYKSPDEGATGGSTQRTAKWDDDYKKYPFAVMLGGGGNFSVPIGAYYNGIESGIGFGGSLRIVASRELAVRLGVSLSGMKKEDLRGSSFAPMIIVEDNTDFNAWRYYAAVEYYKWPRWRVGGKTMYYFFSGIGVISHSFSGTFVACDQADECFLFGSEYSESKFMMTTGGGVVAMMSRSVGFEFGAVLDLVFVGSEGYGETQYAMTLDIRAGLVTAF